MGIIKRQTIQSSIYAYAGVAVGFLTQGVFFPNLFSKAEVGLLSLLIAVSQVLVQASNLGVSNAGGRYFPYFRDTDRQHNGYLLITSLTTLVGFGLCVLGLWLGRPWVIAQYGAQSSLFVDYYYLLIPLTLFTAYFAVFDNYARLLYDPVTGTILQQFVQRILILVAGGLYWLGWVTFPQFLGVWLLAFLLPTVLMAISVARDEALFFSRRYVSVTPELRRNLARYAALTLTSALSTQIIWTIDKAMISTTTRPLRYGCLQHSCQLRCRDCPARHYVVQSRWNAHRRIVEGERPGQYFNDLPKKCPQSAYCGLFGLYGRSGEPAKSVYVAPGGV